MNLTDILLIVIFLFSLWQGYQQGFILAALGLVSWIGSLAIGFAVYPILVIHKLGLWGAPVAFIVSIALAKFLLNVGINYLLEKVGAKPHHHVFNKVLGLIPGAVNGVIWATLIGGVLLLLPFTSSASKQTSRSVLAARVADKVSWLEDKLSDIFSDALTSALPRTHAVVDENKPITLPFEVDNPTRRADLEDQMLALLNHERVSRGLRALKADPELADVARKHSVDMFTRSYFSHYTPQGADPFDRMRAANIRFMTAGENLALAQTLKIAHNGLMNSPGHRANILNSTFGRVGIGIVDGGIYGLMITQNFRN